MFYFRFLMVAGGVLVLSGLVMRELPMRAEGFVPIDLLHTAD